MILWSMLFINQAFFIWMSMNKGLSFWLIFLITFAYSNTINILFFYGTEVIERLSEKIMGQKKKSRWHRTSYVILRRWGRKAKIIPLIIYFFMPIIPIFGVKEACIVIADLVGIKFRTLVILSFLQIIVIYFGKLIFTWLKPPTY